MRMRFPRVWAVVTLVCLFGLVGLPAMAQVTTADLVGKVLDPKGLAVGGAKIVMTDTETGLKREALTNDAGEFTVALLPVGTYRVMIEKEGFARSVFEKVELTVGTKQSLDVTLKLGTASETVTINEEPPMVEQTSSEIRGSVSQLEIKELPVRDRNFASLMTLVPGVRPAPNFDPTKTRSGNASVNGGDGRAFDYNVDGGDNKDNVIGGIVQNFTLEGIQEFNVITNRYSAESGRTVGGVVNVISKSGTNQLHGSAFGEFQLSTLNVKSKFDRDAGPDGKLFTADDINKPKPVYHRYHFGGSAGGPIIKDKLFVFGAYEHKREPGKFRPDPLAVANLALVPFAAPENVITSPYKDHLLTVKLDYRLNDRQNFFLRYGRERWVNPNDQPTGAGSPIADLTESNSNTNQFHSMVLQHSITLSNNKVNVFNFQFQDFVNAISASPGRTFTLPVADGSVATNPSVVFPSAELGQNTNVPQQTLIRKYQFRDDLSWNIGRHAQKFGANWIYLAKLGGFFFFGADGYQISFFDDPLDIFGSKKSFYPNGLATPGAVQSLTFSGGSGRTDNQQRPHSLAFYYQDDFKVTPHLTLNLGLRWDANIRFLPKQLRGTPNTSNRVMNVLRQLIAANPTAPEAADGLARAKLLAGNVDDLTRSTASWKEFQPRVGFAWDPVGTGKHVIRGGYGIARDQVFQNLTLFSLQQANPTLYQTILDLENTTGPADCPLTPTPRPCPSGDVPAFRFGVDPLPAATAVPSELAFGGRGRINDPKMTDPLAQQASIGWAWQINPDYAFSIDYYHVLGIKESRVLNDNPRISSVCNPLFGGNTSDPRCVKGTKTRLLDAAFAAARIGAGRFGEIRNVATNNRSLFDSINVQMKKRMSQNFMMQASYVASWSRSWGGRPTASYGGTGIAIARENQFRDNEFGYTNFDERHRFVLSGVLNLPVGFELAPILQAASARPIDFRSGKDTDGDGRTTIDRVCAGSTIANPLIPGKNNVPFGCDQIKVNRLRGDPFFQLDLAVSKHMNFGEKAKLRLFWEFHNITNRFNKCNAVFNNASQGNFLQPTEGPLSGPYCAGSFGPGFSSPYRSQFGFRFQF